MGTGEIKITEVSLCCFKSEFCVLLFLLKWAKTILIKLYDIYGVSPQQYNVCKKNQQKKRILISLWFVETSPKWADKVPLIYIVCMKETSRIMVKKEKIKNRTKLPFL